MLLISELRPLKNLLAWGSQTLTGQVMLVRVALRCSTKVSIANISLKGHSIHDGIIGNVNLDKLEEIDKIAIFAKVFLQVLILRCSVVFYRAFLLIKHGTDL